MGNNPSRCMDCHSKNPVWFAPNDLWNRVIGGPDAKDDPGGFYCPNCFIARAEGCNFKIVWEVRPAPQSAPDEDEVERVARAIDPDVWRAFDSDRQRYPADPKERFYAYPRIAASLDRARAASAAIRGGRA